MQRFPTLTSNSAERPSSKIAVIRGRKNTWSDTYSSNQLIIEQKYRKNRQYIYIYETKIVWFATTSIAYYASCISYHDSFYKVTKQGTTLAYRCTRWKIDSMNRSD